MGLSTHDIGIVAADTLLSTEVWIVVIGIVMAGVLATTIAAAIIIVLMPNAKPGDAPATGPEAEHDLRSRSAQYWADVIAASFGTTDLCHGRPRVGRHDARRNDSVTIDNVVTVVAECGPVTGFEIALADQPDHRQAIGIARLPRDIASNLVNPIDGFTIARRARLSWNATDCAEALSGELAQRFTCNTGDPNTAKKALGARAIHHLATTPGDGWALQGEWCVLYRAGTWAAGEMEQVATELTQFLTALPAMPRPTNAPLAFVAPDVMAPSELPALAPFAPVRAVAVPHVA